MPSGSENFDCFGGVCCSAPGSILTLLLGAGNTGRGGSLRRVRLMSMWNKRRLSCFGNTYIGPLTVVGHCLFWIVVRDMNLLAGTDGTYLHVVVVVVGFTVVR